MIHAQLSFVQNRNQWNAAVLYQADIASGRAFFGNTKITYAYYSTEDIRTAHDAAHTASEREEASEEIIPAEEEDHLIRCFAFETEFIDAQTPHVNGQQQKNFFFNYFTGKDAAHWASNVPVYEAVYYSGLYPGIDAQYYGSGNQLKYDFIVSPHSDPAQIRIRYNGLRELRMQGEQLVLDLGFTQITEMIPYAYQIIDGKRKEVQCRFVLENNEVHFVFPEGYDRAHALVIDPVVLAATYSGGTGVTGGLSATYDEEGNIYSGGDAFSMGFPATTGAYSLVFNGATDLAISKFNPEGSTLLYCTYIGGGSMEFPQSLWVHQGNLYIYGATFSSDFPTTAQAFDQTLDGICDIYICCLNSTGSALLASTLVGGTSGEGTSLLQPFYADRLRGELQIAANGDVLVCCSSMSLNFPTTAGAFRTTPTGGQDAVVFRMNSTLSTMIWATYIGSGVHDIALGIREAADGTLYICGATNNMFTAFPVVTGCYNTTPMGGADAFVVRLSADGSTLIASTLYGGGLLDAAFFIDLDKDGDVYIYGISRLNTPVTDGVFYVPDGKVFVAKLNAGLTDLLYSTTIGSANGNQMTVGGPTGPGPPTIIGPNPIRPNNNALTAFMVDECERVYFAAYVGTSVWPTTESALYEYSPDNQFCVMVLEENATELLSSTMYSGLHVDGGSGRFDDHGVLYQAACVETSDYFVTMPWAFSDSSATGQYDICVFRINMHSDLIDSITFPNVFTPNNDGINDALIPGAIVSNDFSITIFDRYGIKVYESDDPLAAWDGTHNGNNCSDGVYYYSVRYNFCTELRVKSGFLHLVR
jgi:gliding motility-associated-like protein